MRVGGPRPDDLETVGRMADSLRHRGPDGEGVLDVGGAVLGHRRLAVVDLTPEASQPMQTADGLVAITYNGEVYNHRELRPELERAGHAFRSRSDTEAVLHGWRVWGERVVDRLNGMFAFAVWDAHTQRLFLARDRYGQKPLYYMHTASGDLAFASEPRALRALTAEERPDTLDRTGIAKYLVFDSFPGEGTVYEGVKKLPPGCTLTWEAGEVRVERYYRRQYGVLRPTAAEAAEEVWERLVASVERRLMSDVPLGVFLSGGVDSSAILAAMAASIDPGRIHTFAIGFREASFDESAAAKQVADYVGVEHHVQILDQERLIALLPEILDHLDEPLADASIIPTYALSKFARERVTVALGGDGGDELFAGYDTFVAERFARPYQRLPAMARGAVARLVDALPTSRRRLSPQFLARRFVRGLDANPLRRNLRWFGSFLPEEAAALVVGGPEPEALYSDLDAMEVPQGEQGVLELWTRWYLPDDVLTKVDRASMAVSLEVRAPLLDPDFAAYAHGLPYSLKLRGLARKWIFKRALRGRLPAEILARRKQGFGAPTGDWLRGPLRAELKRLLQHRRLEAQGLLRPDLVERLLQEHLSGTEDHRKKLWAVFVLQRWLEREGR